MLKQLVAIAIAAAFGIAHAADVKPAAAEAKATAPTATVVKSEAPKAAEAVKAPDTKLAAATTETKNDAQPVAKHHVKKAKKVSKKAAKPAATEPAMK
ncbi:hypothetical protein LZ012_00605 [Dechloromonas sp. XY25]|uniref:Amine oxidase n=1 Tax=Dechloromonas hankyongensis TaxID=2908002 RepID=A0ABS9JX45_9RHOO|nr:hypothetical protein [Dechloromonas hankyongensis]MCG2575488.1 hypothetical protein [Dechloromonas hankyongensis]